MVVKHGVRWYAECSDLVIMRRSLFAALAALVAVSASAVACSAPLEEEAGSGEAAVGTKNLTANDFGLEDKEIVLTLDDGPGPRTVELAEWLADEGVPAVFFMVGKNAAANPRAVERVAELSARSGGKIIVANHSMTHTTPLPRQGVDGALAEIMNADGVLARNIAASQAPLPNAVSFFRPPYGAFTALGAANISRINDRGADKYVGPVFWDIGGELNANYSADWACWGKVTVDRCIDGYIAETQRRKRGIMLLHDVHSRTVDMLMGTGQANGRSLIKELRGQNFRFVSLRAHDEAVTRYAEQQQQLARNTEITIEARVTQSEGGRVLVDVSTQNATKVTAVWDNLDNGITFTGNKQLDVTLSPGSHFVTITGYDAQERPVALQRYSVVVAAEITETSHEGENAEGAACVNFSLLKPGMAFRLYNKKVDCATEGAFHPPYASECYAYKGVLRASRAPKLVGPSEWSVEFDLTYGADPNDRSKVSFVMDAQTGEIETGKRFARPGNLPEAPMTSSSTDCAHGEWRGQLHYPKRGGGVIVEDFLARAVRSPQTGGRIDYRE